jgi:DNA (cytosine-5)-methyltransferase 1
MKFGSVCSGIEAASVAWHPLGWTAAWLSEIEPFPCAVLKHHYPDVPNHGDMTLLPEKILSGQVEAPDLFCGGTPCQAFSVAGLRNSLDDARGNLSLTFVGIANAIDHVRSIRGDAPAIVFWENVPGVLNTKDNAFGCFLGALAGESEPITAPGERWSNAGCVFGPQRTVAWRVLDAQYFGVAQRRRRVFVVASARDDINPAEILFEFEGLRRDIAPRRETGERPTASTEDSPRNSSAGLQGVKDCGVELSGPLSARDYKDAGTDGMNKISAKMVPVVQPMAVYENHPADSRVKDMGEVYSTVVSRWGTGGGNLPMVSQPTYAIQGAGATSQSSQGSGWNEEVQFTLNTLDVHGVAQPIGFDSYNLCETGSLTQTLKSPQGGVTESIGAVRVGMAVRRLTPIECERLQGFPDNYTNIPWRKAAESPDGPRYKALGNSWAVPVVAWIGQRIQDQIK